MMDAPPPPLGSMANPASASGSYSPPEQAGSREERLDAVLRGARTALFSLGNLAARPECSDALAGLDLPTTLGSLTSHTDAVLREYALRILQKLKDRAAS